MLNLSDTNTPAGSNTADRNGKRQRKNGLSCLLYSSLTLYRLQAHLEIPQLQYPDLNIEIRQLDTIKRPLQAISITPIERYADNEEVEVQNMSSYPQRRRDVGAVWHGSSNPPMSQTKRARLSIAKTATEEERADLARYLRAYVAATAERDGEVAPEARRRLETALVEVEGR